MVDLPAFLPFSPPSFGAMPQPHSPQLTLFVPELLWPDPDDRDVWDGLDCPALAWLFARGSLSASAQQPAERALMELFGRAADVACAPVRLLGEQELFQDDAGTTDWIAVDPVHLRLERERLVLAGDEVLAVNEEEAAALVDTLNGYFPELGVFHAAAPDRWYLKLAGGPTSDALLRLKAPAPSEVIGRSVEGLLADLTEEREVRRLLNEIQTVLHAHPVNQRRDAAGRATLNSLWLWGGGRLPQRRKAMTGFDGVHGADALVQGLARLDGVPELPHVDSAEVLLALNAAKHALVVLNDLSSPVQYEDGPRYRRTLLDLESRWFGPARQALAGGRLDRLILVAPCAYGRIDWETGRSAKWRFWRSPQPLAHTVSALAGDMTIRTENP